MLGIFHKIKKTPEVEQQNSPISVSDNTVETISEPIEPQAIDTDQQEVNPVDQQTNTQPIAAAPAVQEPDPREKELDELLNQLRDDRRYTIEEARKKGVPLKALIHASTLWLSDNLDDWTAANDTIYSFTSPYGLKQLQYPGKTSTAIPNINIERRQQSDIRTGKMYRNAKTWNPAVGCGFNCIYCQPSFQRVVARSTKQSGVNCDDCLKYYPHEHPERLSRIPSNDIIFAFGNGDISFYREAFVEKAIDELINNLHRSKKSKIVYFQSKDPQCFTKYLGKLKSIEDSVVLLTTLETNRDEAYSDISKAPAPSIRYKAFLALDWKRKIVTIEPVMDFDLEIFVEWIREISPEAVYLGFNSKSDKVKLGQIKQRYQNRHRILVNLTVES